MNKPKSRIALAAVVVGVGVVGVYVLGPTLAVYTSTFASYDEASRAGAVGPSVWIPPFIHRSATSISEAHDIDTNEVWLSYSFGPQDPGLTSDACQEVVREAVVWPDASRVKEKFPSHFEQAYTASKGSGNKYLACAHSGLRYFFVVDASANKVYAWGSRS